MLVEPRPLGSARARLRRVWLAVAVVILFGACGDPNAAATASDSNSSSRQSFVGELTERGPSSSSGFFEEIHYRNPADPAGKPYAVERIVVQLPAGSRIDTSVPDRCTASDPELLLRGADACPTRSKVGSGRLTLDFGAVLGLVDADVMLFNNSGELIFLIETINTPLPLRFATRAKVEDGSFITTSPPLPSVPPDPDAFMAIRDVQLEIDPVANRAEMPAGAYLTTPPSCTGHWTTTATFTYRDGATEVVESRSTCVVQLG